MSTIAVPNVLDGQQRLPLRTGPLGVIRGHPMVSFLVLIFALT